MLSYLSVKHLAILDNIEVDFKAGMTALTGETGAGKSLLIDAIGLLLGDRASSDIVRTGEPYCEITGIFTALDQPAIEALKALDIDTADQECMITRQIATNSANTIKINRKTVTLQDLRSLTRHLADIHTQHDTKRLINPETYLALIDHFDSAITVDLSAYAHARKVYINALEDFINLKNAKEEMLERLDYERFQVEEIDKHNLHPEEEDALAQQLERLHNFDKIFQAFKHAMEGLKDKDALENIYDAAASLDIVAGFDERYLALSQRIKSAYYELDDIKDTLSETLASLDFDPATLENLETRQHTLETLKRKYRRGIPEIIEMHETLKVSLARHENYDALLHEKEKTLKEAFESVKDYARILSENRQTQAKRIETSLVEDLESLALKQTTFRITFKDVDTSDMLKSEVFKEDGIDEVDFLLSTNIGESMKPLSKVASGGELSRIMLALKDILIKNMKLSMIIFDEIDTGVSGYVAGQVAAKIADIAKSTQVITITHLPQVAAKADQHYHIYKASDTQRTKAFIRILDREGRIRELAAMISSDRVTEHAMKSAEALLDK